MDNDIYFYDEWCKLFAQREKLELRKVSFECDFGRVDYCFLVRPIVINGIKKDYFDIVTPYAFSGPRLFPSIENEKCAYDLVSAFDNFFNNYCIKERIVAEYVQFNPWINNCTFFKDIYNLELRDTIVGIDLTKEDLIYNEINSQRRNLIRKATKLNITVEYDYDGVMVDEFLRLYHFTIEKYDVPTYYQYSKSFLLDIFNALHGSVYFAYCKYKDCITSISMILTSDYYSHYFLAGNDSDFLFTNSVSLLLYNVALKSKNENKKFFILGGADGGMMMFKKSFTRNCFFDYYVGKKIRNESKYCEFVLENGIIDTPYFPAYRFNKNTQYISWQNNHPK